MKSITGEVKSSLFQTGTQIELAVVAGSAGSEIDDGRSRDSMKSKSTR